METNAQVLRVSSASCRSERHNSWRSGSLGQPRWDAGFDVACRCDRFLLLGTLYFVFLSHVLITFLLLACDSGALSFDCHAYSFFICRASFPHLPMLFFLRVSSFMIFFLCVCVCRLEATCLLFLLPAVAYTCPLFPCRYFLFLFFVGVSMTVQRGSMTPARGWRLVAAWLGDLCFCVSFFFFY